MAVSGTWYPDDPQALAADVDRHVAAASVEPTPHPPRALIAPHAGLMYSGPIAAHAYKLASAATYRAVVMIGPSHFVPFRGVALWSDGAWQSPFGPVRVDRELAAAIRAESDQFIDHPAAHGREHSLEMQLPFIARLLPEVPIVPLVMGHQSRETAMAAGHALARALASRDDVLLVASSDLSHFEEASAAAALDGVVLRHVEAMNADGLMAALEQRPGHACGGGPMVSVLEAARELGAASSRVLAYGDSGDVSGDKSSVVGYLAAALW